MAVEIGAQVGMRRNAVEFDVAGFTGVAVHSASRPAGVMRPSRSSRSAMARLRAEEVPRVRRGVKRW